MTLPELQQRAEDLKSLLEKLNENSSKSEKINEATNELLDKGNPSAEELEAQLNQHDERNQEVKSIFESLIDLLPPGYEINNPDFQRVKSMVDELPEKRAGESSKE